MDKIRRGLSNQAIGFIPLLLFLLLDNYLNYTLSFTVSIGLSIVCTFLYRLFAKQKIYQFSFIPAAVILLLYSIFIVFNLEPAIYSRASLLMEILIIGVLMITVFLRKTVLVKCGQRKFSALKKSILRSGLNEFFYISRIFLYTYMVHLLIVVYFLLSENHDYTSFLMRILLDYMPILLGVFIIAYEQVRINLIQDTLNKEVWLPVLNNKGMVIGSMAQSVSQASSKKYIHPIVRVIVMYKGMFYLVKRSPQDYISPGLLDYPFHTYVLFGESIPETANQLVSKVLQTSPSLSPLLTYSFENNKVKQLVSLFIFRPTDEEIQVFDHGKLWTPRQIEENLDSNLFSEYFVQEYPYLQNTVLLAETIMYGPDENRDETPLPES